jgi:putative membrane protein
MIALGFILFYFLRPSSKNAGEHSSAQDILDKRYANGEINRQAYEDKSKALRRIA